MEGYWCWLVRVRCYLQDMNFLHIWMYLVALNWAHQLTAENHKSSTWIMTTCLIVYAKYQRVPFPWVVELSLGSVIAHSCLFFQCALECDLAFDNIFNLIQLLKFSKMCDLQISLLNWPFQIIWLLNRSVMTSLQHKYLEICKENLICWWQ